ncbi:hypothetical protein H8N03_01100 [Ramlibacter sp. USB13]|uniref:DUF4230 domain-containing protein n=1 Tax=Ramlibacter cellulosilyticus TaxID=2764187 RepID=A0A923MNW3_9BURK|nr:hypothetical protein [Ramlibacter cellulosilyticus]MBC5781519.1 hypothetical protein [Ramlibacter cellulosilyticus]
MHRLPMKPIRTLALATLVVLAGLGAWHQLGRIGSTTEQKVDTLDPAQVQLIRTPGGFLQVSEMAKVEEFAWRTTWDCPVVDCSSLPRTVSKIRARAHYVYRIPLAAQWRLEPEGDHYKLSVPPLQLQRPVAFDTAGMEILTTEQSVFSPAAAPNRENALRHLGPELASRGATPPYLDAQQRTAEQTVREFARKWMVEQGKRAERPIRVVFDAPNPL